MFSSASPGSVPAKGSAERGVERRSTTGSIGSSRYRAPRLSATLLASVPRLVGACSATASRRRRPAPGPAPRTASAAVRAESIPPEIPRTTSRKPFFCDVVAQPELEREPHLLELVEERRGDRRGGLPVRSTAAPSSITGGSRQPGCSRASARRRASRQPAGDSRGRVDVDDEQRLLERRAAGDDVAVLVEHERCGRRRPARPGRRRRSRRRPSRRCPARGWRASPRARAPCRDGTARPRRSRSRARRRARARSRAGPAARCPRRSSAR